MFEFTIYKLKYYALLFELEYFKNKLNNFLLDNSLKNFFTKQKPTYTIMKRYELERTNLDDFRISTHYC